jgi:hypothetical protein
MGDSANLLKAIEDLTAKIERMEATVSKIDGLAAKIDKLTPLAPVAAQLAALPEKVTTLQAKTFENTEEVHALNLAMIRAENSQREGKRPADADADASAASFHPKTGHGPPPPPPEPFRRQGDHYRGPPRDQFRDTHDGDDHGSSDSRFHRASAWSFPPSTARRTPSPG